MISFMINELIKSKFIEHKGNINRLSRNHRMHLLIDE